MNRGLTFRTLTGVMCVLSAMALPSMGLDFSVEPIRLGEFQVLSIAFSPDGQTVAAWHQAEQAVCLWDVRIQQQVGTLKEGLRNIDSMAFSPDGILLALAGEDNTIRLWDVAVGYEVGVMQSPTLYGAPSIAFSPDGVILASAGGWNRSVVTLWDVQTQQQAGSLSESAQQHIIAVAFSPDGKLVASGGDRQDGAVRLWDVLIRQQVGALRGHLDVTESLAFSPDGKILASAGGANDKAVYLWDVETQTRLGILGGHSAHVGSIAFSPDGTLLASTVYWDNTVHIWDVARQQELGVLKGHDATNFGWSDNVAFSSDGRWLACGSENGVELWELNLQIDARASRPSPADEATDVSRDVVLTWSPGIYAPPTNGHRVYFSANFNDVNDRIGETMQNANSYDPGRLDFNTTYYWRVDEVNGPPDHTVREGKIWRFTTEPVGYPLGKKAITATASSSIVGQEPENTVNGSGLNDNDLHSTDTYDMWLSSNEPHGAWIQYEFDKVYKLHQMSIWNHNTVPESFVGLGVKEASITYSIDGVTWTSLGATHEFAQGSGSVAYAANTTIDLAGADVKYIKITANSNWGGIVPQFGFSEVRFFYIPLSARKPSPGSGAAKVDLDTSLTWRAGREAATHDVYLSTDEQAVIDGNALLSTVTDASYTPSAFELGGTYYWRIDEVNEVETPATWKGDVWSFSTPEYIVVEDFEDYNDYPLHEIYTTWQDGYENPANGAQAGYLTPNWIAGEHYVEIWVVHGGNQSMPLFYSNINGAMYSESTSTFDVSQDWTKYGAKTLSLWFYGAIENVAAQMYVKLNDSKVTYDGDPRELTQIGWQTWNIDLASFSTDLQNVKTLSIGFDGHGATGRVLFEDIRLYPYNRQWITPTEPDPAHLVAHWEFEGNFDDSSGNRHHGTAHGMGRSSPFIEGKVGQAIDFGSVQFVEIIGYKGVVGDGSETPPWSITAWVRTETGGEVVGWGNSNNRMEFWINDGGRIRAEGGGGRTLGDTRINDGQWHHIAVTVQPNSLYNSGVDLWLDGRLDTQPSGDPDPWHPVAGVDVKIGIRYDGNSRQFTGAIDDLRIYNRALSHAEVAWLAGKTEPFDKPF